MPGREYRHCPVCGEDKLATEFYRDRSKASGYSSRCKLCDNARRSRYPATPRPPRDPIADRVCAPCGEMYTPHRKDQRFCSSECHRQGDRITVNCARCGAPVMRRSRDLERNPLSYCTRICSGRARRRQPGTDLIGPVPRRIVVSGPPGHTQAAHMDSWAMR